MVTDPEIGLALASWLKAKRLEKNATKRALATALNCHHSIVGKIETGERRLEVGEYVQICRSLQIDPTEGIRYIYSATSGLTSK